MLVAVPSPRSALPVLAGFRLEGVIARGGMGEVWKARHQATGAPAAVKVVRPDAPARAAALSLADEIAILEALDHPAVVSVYASGEVPEEGAPPLVPGTPFVVLEWAPGGSLADVGPPDRWSRIREVLSDVLGALAHAHARGFVHRDLKPQNVLVSGDRVLLADFGAASGAGDAHRSAGTPRYMAPEQFGGDPAAVGPAADLYAVGCLAHWLLTGRPPFDDYDPVALSRRHRTEPPPRLPKAAWIPPGLADWADTLLAKDPRHRFADAASAQVALRSLPAPALDPIAFPVRGAAPAEPSTWEGLTYDLEIPRPAPPPPPIAHLRPWPRPRPVEDWRSRERETRRAGAMAHVDREFFASRGLRVPAWMAREEDRDLLWAALRDVHATRTLTEVRVCSDGDLRSWLAERVVEDGIATLADATKGLAGMLRSRLSPESASWEHRLAASRRACRTHGARDAVEVHLLAAAMGAEGELDERVDTAVRWLLREAESAPLVVWTREDDPEGERLAAALDALASRRSVPILVVRARL
jgi:serine/threonine protein kinase